MITSKHLLCRPARVCIWLVGALQRLRPVSAAKWLDVQNKGAIRDLPVPLFCPREADWIELDVQAWRELSENPLFSSSSFQTGFGLIKTTYDLSIREDDRRKSCCVFESWHLIRQLWGLACEYATKRPCCWKFFRFMQLRVPVSDVYLWVSEYLRRFWVLDLVGPAGNGLVAVWCIGPCL